MKYNLISEITTKRRLDKRRGTGMTSELESKSIF